MALPQFSPIQDNETLVTLKTNLGDITLRFFPQEAPKAVENFVTHAKNGYYDGVIFHRVISGFMIQGGDPTGTGYGDPSQKKIKGEFAANGVKNDIAHVRGVISMARSQNMDSATSQFFIMHADASYLDGQYAAFGRVIEGIEVVDEIAGVATDFSDRPLVEQKIKTIRTVKTDA